VKGLQLEDSAVDISLAKSSVTRTNA